MANPEGKTRPNPSGGKPRNLTDIEARQLRQAEVVRKRLDRILAEKGADWVPDKEWLDAYHKNGDLITRLARGIRLGREFDRKHREQLTDDELDLVFSRELLRVAQRFTAEQWALLDSIRAKQVAFVEGAERTQFAEGNQAAKGHQ